MTPTTRAGIALFTDMEPGDMWESDGVTPEDVAKVEAEAREDERARLRAAVEAIPNPWPFPYVGDVKRGPCGASVEGFRVAVLALLAPDSTGGTE